MTLRPDLPPLPLDHIGVAVPSLGGAARLLERLAGRRATAPVRAESQAAEICFVGALELLAPTGEDGPVARFLARRGPGLHHVAYRTEDLPALMDSLRDEGFEFTSQEPMTGAGGHRIAFVHPRSAGGVLVELVEKRNASSPPTSSRRSTSRTNQAPSRSCTTTKGASAVDPEAKSSATTTATGGPDPAPCPSTAVDPSPTTRKPV